jgi:hypothetical protein
MADMRGFARNSSREGREAGFVLKLIRENGRVTPTLCNLDSTPIVLLCEQWPRLAQAAARLPASATVHYAHMYIGWQQRPAMSVATRRFLENSTMIEIDRGSLCLIAGASTILASNGWLAERFVPDPICSLGLLIDRNPDSKAAPIFHPNQAGPMGLCLNAYRA